MSEGALSHDQLRFTAAFQPAAGQHWTSWPPSTPSDVPPRTNLPTPITSFIGRASELTDVQHCLAAARLVTLIGAGGVGQTRLALPLAQDMLAVYPPTVRRSRLAPPLPPAATPHLT